MSYVQSLLGWDQEVNMMGYKTVEGRSEQSALLSQLIHQRLVSDKASKLIKDAEKRKDLNDIDAAMLREAKRVYDQEVKLPEELVVEITKTAALSQQSGQKARQNKDFKSFIPLLEKTVELQKEKAEKLGKKEKAEIMLADSAAGVGCPVIASIQGSDYIIAITEPTPSALNDLKRALRTVEHFRIPYGIVINKWDLNKNFSKKIEEFAEKYKIPILGKIPYDKQFVNALVNLKPIVVFDKRFEPIFTKILSKLKIK
ncbi:MAG: hypothetical protein KAT57_13325 [Candidatus Lokiarchaeota archaeon]|nr:hypothetical protein [Candidatus Lokiarchaeota archaeon]